MSSVSAPNSRHVVVKKRSQPLRRALLRFLFSLTILAIAVPGLSLASVESELAFDRAVAAYDDGDLINAVLGFERVLEEDPNDASALQYLGLIAAQRGDIENAVAQLEQLVAHHPSLVPARVDLATLYLKTGRDEEALELLDAALEVEPDHALALLYQGIALYRVRAFPSAIEALERAGELDDRLSSEASYYVGLSNSYLGDARAAAAAFETASIGSPESPLGRSATRLHRLAERSARPWSLAATLGLEYNDNLRLSSDEDLSSPLIPDTGKSSSGASVIGLQGQVEAYANDAFTWRVGYDGDLRLYWSNDEVLPLRGPRTGFT